MINDEFFAYSWHVDKAERNCTVIRIYGLDNKNRNVCVTVNNFTPYVYIELPETVKWGTRESPNLASAQLLSSTLDSILKDQKPLVKKLMFKKRLYYANIENGRRQMFPYLFCSFNTSADVMKLSGLLRRPLYVGGLGSLRLRVHENNANPILQMISQRKLPPAGWIQFTGKLVSECDKLTFCHKEYVVSWKHLSPKDSDEVARPLIMAFDLEVNSSVPSSMPKSFRPADKIFQISCVFLRQGEPENTTEKILLTLGEANSEMLEKGSKIRSFKIEHDLLVGFTELIRERQPNIIAGYNIFGFDIPYMIDRSKFPCYCSNLFDQQGMNKNSHAEEREINWSSSAYKNQVFKFLDAEGRILVDLLPIVKRDYKLHNYKLKTISEHLLKDSTKDPLTAKGIFKCYRLGMLGGEKGKKALGLCGKYCIQDSFLVIQLFEVMTTWIALCEMSKVTNVPVFDLFTRGQQLKVFSAVYKKCTHENCVVERDAYIVKPDDFYVGATVFPPKPGLYDKVVPFDFSSLYPSVIIAKNICWSTLVLDENVPDSLCHVMKWDEHFGCCHDPKEIRKAYINEKIKKSDVLLKELRRLRDLKANKNCKQDYVDKINAQIAKMKPLRQERSQINKTKNTHKMCGSRYFRWLKEPRGVLPEIMIHLLDTRKATKNLMKEVSGKMKGCSDESELKQLRTYYDVLDKRQLALKVSANSGYGIMGVKKGMLPFMPGAMCTTYAGRLAIEKAAQEIQTKHKGVIVYGDTDSNYVSFPHLTTAKECWENAEHVAKTVSALFPKPMALLFEAKIYWLFLILSKKRYMTIGCGPDGILSTEIDKKGVLLNRRDNCAFVRDVYSKITMMVFYKKSIEDIMYEAVENLNRLCSHSVPMNQFIITKSVGDIKDMVPEPGTNAKTGKDCWKIGDYILKTPLSSDPKKRQEQLDSKDCSSPEEYYLHSLPAQVQLAEKMKTRGQLVAPGTRLEFVITTQGGHKAKQYIKIEDADYFKRHAESLQLDYLYYLKQLVNPADQILNLTSLKDFMKSQYDFRLKVREKVLSELRSYFRPKIILK